MTDTRTKSESQQAEAQAQKSQQSQQSQPVQQSAPYPCPHLVTDNQGRCEHCYQFIGEVK